MCNYFLDCYKFDTSKSDGQFKKTASNEKLKKLRPDFKFTDPSIGKNLLICNESAGEGGRVSYFILMANLH